ncbi:MAG: energy transducer TonB [candidate division KSB1 bacterium]|nr:energy transducer TonB [candidate division KSB1 bacterium]MDZ7295379.1 energy transducer TonB [candidate division KSB1 bacterium]MDZ7337880.1 energy transducer TonB [candidate division KSB1 bacterium]MDZ7377779.1 energy transducer TonB [candidate division KSB1 bacterium]MDZ7385276.1 energy transducer TonB [candidate division KSB1 bacterium]
MLRRKDPKADLKLQYRKVFQLSMVLALVLLIGMFQASKRYEIRTQRVESIDFKMQVDEIPPTEQMDRPPAPSRPAVPIESESEDIPEDETISTTEMDFSELPPPPPPPEQVDESAQIFVAWDEPPEPIGGFEAIQRALKYPEIARKAGVEGRVYVIAVISDKGEVIKAWAQNSLGNNGCDEAAIAAVKAVKWKPAKQRDKPVTVQIGIPVIFKLK